MVDSESIVLVQMDIHVYLNATPFVQAERFVEFVRRTNLPRVKILLNVQVIGAPEFLDSVNQKKVDVIAAAEHQMDFVVHKILIVPRNIVIQRKE